MAQSEVFPIIIFMQNLHCFPSGTKEKNVSFSLFRPSFLSEYEVSVYDLKDHPDFQYRPGTVVIRVANFQGEDEVCSAGQVLDNYPEGRVRVWWVEGHISMCWPQDLYKVGEYDSDEGELWDDGTSDDGSWQTESEDCTNDDG